MIYFPNNSENINRRIYYNFQHKDESLKKKKKKKEVLPLIAHCTSLLE